MMRGYAEHEHCRRNFILSYFGEEFQPPCGMCDNCDAGSSEEAADRPLDELRGVRGGGQMRCLCSSFLPMTMRWISDVPSPISSSGASR